MNIKSYLYKSVVMSAAVCAAGVMLTACDDVAPDDRYTKVERPNIARRVLIQEFTGQLCLNCPQGAAMVHSLQEQNPGAIISVNLHPENTQYTIPLGGLRLTSPVATAWYREYRPSMFPAVIIDGATPNTNLSTWTSAVNAALEVESSADLDLDTEYNASTRELTVTYNAHFNKYYEGTLYINLWVTEDGIVGAQYSGNDILRDYVHNHVLRTSLTGDFGVKVADSFIPDEEYTGTFTITLNEGWVAENCNVVGFLGNASARVVEQSAETSLVNKN